MICKMAATVANWKISHDCSQTVYQIEPKVGGRHWGPRAVILKFFKRHLLPNSNADASERHRDWELLKSFCRYPRRPPRWRSWKSSDLICSRMVSDWGELWWEALGRHGNSEMLKPFCYDIYDGRHNSQLEDRQLLTAPCQLIPSYVYLQLSESNQLNKIHIVYTTNRSKTVILVCVVCSLYGL